MLNFYYVDLYFDPAESSFERILEGTCRGLEQAGCAFDTLTMPPESLSLLPPDTDLSTISASGFAQAGSRYFTSMGQSGNMMVSFPPAWGRVRYKYDFTFDLEILDDVEDEEREINMSARSIGLSFLYTANTDLGRKVKANISFWEDYVLSHGKVETHARNVRAVIGFVESICAQVKPYFGAMNSEIHLNTDASLEKLKVQGIPEGNDFAFIGKRLAGALDVEELKRRNCGVKVVNGDSVLIQFTDKWPRNLSLAP